MRGNSAKRGTERARRGLTALLALLLLLTFAGCGAKPAAEAGAEAVQDGPVPHTYDDGRARPSSCGKLRVLNGKLCAEDGEPVMLRGVSTHSLIIAEDFLNEALFRELSEDRGVNLIRLAMYTHGTGIVGYCAKGDKERHKKDVEKGVELARLEDMYVIIDWHILSDGDPNAHLDEAKLFFAEMAERYAGYDNVLYEICNEPNGVDWQAVRAYAEQVVPVIREKDPGSVVIVGNPDWSKDLETVAADPLAFDNVLYTLHFYSASHGQEYRDMTERVSRAGLPVFVTEFGVTSSSGGFPRDLESADLWIDLLERENISWCMWSFSAVSEPCSALRSGVLKYSGFERDDYSPTGQWLLDTLEKHGSR